MILAGILAACARTVKYAEFIKATSNRNTAEKISVYEIGDTIPNGAIVRGRVWLGEIGFSHSCGYNDALFLARQKTREVDADAVPTNHVQKHSTLPRAMR